jgi:lipopolysaccharide biosynthesis glycosyltransferase
VGYRQSIFIGFDPRECDAFAVCRGTMIAKMGPMPPVGVYGIVLDVLRQRGLYTRPTEVRPGFDRPILFDVISQHPMATEFAISRFLTGHLAQQGYAVFMDCDMLVRDNIRRLFDFCQADRTKALWCVKHAHEPTGEFKMDGQVQSAYGRKNWSSFMVWNVDHEANKSLTIDMINTLPGRDLHRFCWLDDDEIGELDLGWNWLVGASPPIEKPKVVHFTNGLPSMRGFDNQPFADEWRKARNQWATPA